MNFLKEISDLSPRNNIPCLISNDTLFLHVPSLLAAWRKKYMNKKTGYIKRTSIYDFLKSQPGFVAFGVNKRISGKNFRCVVFINSLAPREILDVIHGK